MPVPAALAYATLAASAVLVVAALALGVKLRAAASRACGRGVSVYDLGADLRLPATLHSRGYQFALYLTLKSLPREKASVNAPSR